MVSEERFVYNLLFTFELVAYVVPITFLMGLVFALFLNSGKLFLKPIASLLLVLPWVTPIVAWAMSVRYLFAPGGPYSILLEKVLGFPLRIFSDPVGSKIFLMINLVWISAPQATLFTISALSSVPRSVIEAARLDGAYGISLFRHIILPLIKEKLLIVLILIITFTIMAAEAILAFTGGGPGFVTETLAVRMYTEGRMFHNFGYASSIGVFLLIIAFILGLMLLLLAKER